MVCIIHFGAQKSLQNLSITLWSWIFFVRFQSRRNRANIPRVWRFDVSCHEGQMLFIFRTILEKDIVFPMLSIFQSFSQVWARHRTCCPLRVIKFHPNNESFFRPIDLPVWSRDHAMNLSLGPSGSCWINAEEGHEGCSFFLLSLGNAKVQLLVSWIWGRQRTF